MSQASPAPAHRRRRSDASGEPRRPRRCGDVGDGRRGACLGTVSPWLLNKRFGARQRHCCFPCRETRWKPSNPSTTFEPWAPGHVSTRRF